MKKGLITSICCFIFLSAFIMVLFGCEKEETLKTEFTGKSIVYQLVSSPEFNISGTATFKEKKDGSTQVVINLEGISGDQYHPVHLHYGPINKEGDLAALLHPLYGVTGKSVTELKMFADESPITYKELLGFNGSIRVHMDDGANKNVILAYNNIGENPTVLGSASANSIAVCKSTY